MTRCRRIGIVIGKAALALCATSFLGLGVHAQTTTYVPNAATSGSWHGAGRWDNGIPNAAGAVAVLNQPISSAVNQAGGPATGGTYTLSLGGLDTTIGSLTSNNASDAAQSFRTQITNGKLIFESTSGPAMLTENLGASTEIESRMRIAVPIQLNSDLVVTQNHALNRNTSTELTQRIDGDAARTITKEGFGNVQLSFSNSLGENEGFLGNVIINNGGIRLIGLPNSDTVTATTVFSKAAGVTVNAGGQLQFGNTVSSVSFADGAELKLNGSGKTAPATTTQNDGALRFEQSAGFGVICNFNNAVNLQSASHINVAAVDTTGVLTNEVRGVGQLQKTGSGLLRLLSTNVYSGGTTVSSGALAVDNVTGSGVGTGDVNVNGGTLGGAGFIGASGDASSVTLTGGVLSPGSLTATTTLTSPSGLITAPGILTVSGDLNFDGASSLDIDLTGAVVGSEYDQVVCSGAVSLGSATLNLSLNGFAPSGTESFTLISNTGAGAVVGEFGNYAQGAAVDLGGVTYYMNYQGGTGNDVVLSPTAPGVADADFDGDNDVDGADFLIWQRGFGTAGGQPQGNANGDGTIDGADLAIWKSQFGSVGAESAVGAVPEPATLATVALGAMTAFGLARSQRRQGQGA